MAKEAAARRSARKSEPFGFSLGLLQGLLTAAAVTVLGVAVFALILRFFDVSDTLISVANQALKLLSIFLGVKAGCRKGGSVLKGALIGLVYMVLGVMGYQLLSGLDATPASYLADLAMGVAAGGLFGMILGVKSRK